MKVVVGMRVMYVGQNLTFYGKLAVVTNIDEIMHSGPSQGRLLYVTFDDLVTWKGEAKRDWATYEASVIFPSLPFSSYKASEWLE